MTGSLSCVWNDFPCYVVKNRKTNVGPQWLWGLEAGVLEKLESVVVLHTRSWSSVVQWWLLLVPKIVKGGDMSSYISISFLIHMGLSANTVLPIPMDYEWLIISILMKKNMFFHFQFTQRQIFPRSDGDDRLYETLGSARGPPGNAGSPLNPARFASVFPSKNWDHLRQRAKSPHLGA